MFNPPPMDSMDASVENSTFPPPSMSPPPMDNFSPDKEFSPPPLDDFSPSKEFSPPPLLGGGKAFSPPPLDDFSPSKEVPPLQFSPPFFGRSTGSGIEEDHASKGKNASSHQRSAFYNSKKAISLRPYLAHFHVF